MINVDVDPWHVFTAGFGHMPKPYTAVVTLLDLTLFVILGIQVSLARVKHKVPAPGMDGPAIFMRIFRAHANTAEQLIVHLPLLWMAAFAMDDVFATAFGCVWTFGRCLYVVRYHKKASRRTKGFVIGLAINIILGLAILTSAIASF